MIWATISQQEPIQRNPGIPLTKIEITIIFETQSIFLVEVFLVYPCEFSGKTKPSTNHQLDSAAPAKHPSLTRALVPRAHHVHSSHDPCQADAKSNHLRWWLTCIFPLVVEPTHLKNMRKSNWKSSLNNNRNNDKNIWNRHPGIFSISKSSKTSRTKSAPSPVISRVTTV